MKKIFILFIISSLVLSCQIRAKYLEMKDSTFEVIEYKNYKELAYPLGNEIGIWFHEEGFNSVTGLTIGENDYIYFGDAVFGRINKLNFKTGKIIYGEKNIVDELIMDLIYFNQYIYVVTLNSSIYVLNENLELVNKYKYALMASIKFFYEKTDNVININVRHDPGLHIFKMRDGSLISKEVQITTNEAEYFALQDKANESVQGKKYKKIESDGINYLMSSNRFYKLKNKINEYWMPNLDFTDRLVVHFDVNEQEVTFKINEY